MSGEDFARLISYSRQIGDGPYLISSPLFIALSNSIYIAEMGVALLLLRRSNRRIGVIAAVAFMVATEAVARELLFGSLFVAAILLYERTGVIRWVVPAYAAFYLMLLLIRLLFPGVYYT